MMKSETIRGKKVLHRRKMRKKHTVFSELKYRWMTKTPKFWKKVMNMAIAIGTSATAIIGADQMLNLQSYGVPSFIFTTCGYIITACFALGLAAKITKQ